MASPSSEPTKLRQLLDRAIACHQRGQLGEAERLYLDILKAEPGHFDAQHLLGIVRHQQGRGLEALALIDAALQVNPRSAQALANQSLVLCELRRYDEALASSDQALALRPDFVEALNNRGNALQRLKRYDEALASFDQVLALRGDFVEAHNNRGNALQGLKRYPEALASYDRALALRPGYAEAFYNRGSALKELMRYDEALASFDRALALRPNHAETLFNRGDTLHELKRYAEAIASYDRAIALRPDHPYAYSGLAESALAICDWTRTAKLAERLAALVAEQKAIVNPFTLIRLNDDAALHRQCATAFIADKIVGPRPPLWTGRIWSHAKVRIAYLSADFHSHATAYLMAELFERHDRARFEVHGVSFGRDDGSEIRRRLVKGFDRFHDVRGKSDREVATLLSDLEVDIAIDLKGYTQDSRPEILSHRPAPIQVSYLGYPGTMGADFIDYIIADKVVLPFDRQPHYAEKIVQLSGQLPGQRPPTRHRCAHADAGRGRAAGRRILCSAASTTTTRSRPRCSTSGCGCWRACPGACCGCCARPPTRRQIFAARQRRAASIRRGWCLPGASSSTSTSRAIGWPISSSTRFPTTRTPRQATRCGRVCPCSPARARHSRRASRAACSTPSACPSW